MELTLLGDDHRAQGGRRWPCLNIVTDGTVNRIECGDYRQKDGIPDTLFISNTSTACIGGLEALAMNALREGKCPVKIVCTKETRETISKVMQTACTALGAGAQAENFFYFAEPDQQKDLYVTIDKRGCYIIVENNVIVWCPTGKLLPTDYDYPNATAAYTFVDGEWPPATLKWAERKIIDADASESERVKPFVRMVLMGTPASYVHDFSLFEDVDDTDRALLTKRYIDGKTVIGAVL